MTVATVIKEIELKPEKNRLEISVAEICLARNDQLTSAQVKGGKHGDKRAGGKYVSHILKKAPERRDIRGYFRGAATAHVSGDF